MDPAHLTVGIICNVKVNVKVTFERLSSEKRQYLSEMSTRKFVEKFPFATVILKSYFNLNTCVTMMKHFIWHLL